MKHIAVFCRSSNGALPLYREQAFALGQALAQRGLTLVYGGANVGLSDTNAEILLDQLASYTAPSVKTYLKDESQT